MLWVGTRFIRRGLIFRRMNLMESIYLIMQLRLRLSKMDGFKWIFRYKIIYKFIWKKRIRFDALYGNYSLQSTWKQVMKGNNFVFFIILFRKSVFLHFLLTKRRLERRLSVNKMSFDLHKVERYKKWFEKLRPKKIPLYSQIFSVNYATLEVDDF